MKESMIIKEEVLFKASAEKVWEMLLDPKMTKKYMFGCEVFSDWKIGSPVLWKGKTEDGEEVIYVKGEVLEYEEGKRVCSTTFDPNLGWEDIPANYVKLTYELETVEDGTKLTITQGDFSGAVEGEKRYEESVRGWRDLVVPTMKKLMGE